MGEFVFIVIQNCDNRVNLIIGVLPCVLDISYYELISMLNKYTICEYVNKFISYLKCFYLFLNLKVRTLLTYLLLL